MPDVMCRVCGKPAWVHGHGLCRGDYNRWALHASTEERFWIKVDKNNPGPEEKPELGPCWVWIAGKTQGGYGVFHVNGKSARAHRWSYMHFVGPIPEGLDMDHLCRNRACVCPDHLEPVTERENVLRSPIAPPTINAGKLFCDHGHEFTPENTRILQADGSRQCKECSRRSTREAGIRTRAAERAAEVAAGVRLAPSQQAELRDWIGSGRAASLRVASGMTSTEAAQSLGITQTSLTNWERKGTYPLAAHAVRYHRMLTEFGRDPRVAVLPVESLTAYQEAELAAWIASGHARALREAASLSRPDAARQMSLGGRSTVRRWESGLAFPRWDYAVNYHAFLADLDRQQAA
jgi:DNA-binding transcriptional regulator YiaG